MMHEHEPVEVSNSYDAVQGPALQSLCCQHRSPNSEQRQGTTPLRPGQAGRPPKNKQPADHQKTTVTTPGNHQKT